MNRFLFLFLILTLFGKLSSQTLIVKDKESNNVLESVIIIGINSNLNVTTNSKGEADISEFKSVDLIEIWNLGYKTIRKTYKQLDSLNFIILMEPSNLNLDEIVVSSTGWRQKSDNIPSKIISISNKEVALQNPQTAADLLGVSGKVYIQKSQQGGGSPMIRGFATNRLLYTVDGVRMNTAIFRGGNIQNVINLDPFTIENTEVFFGPGSVIYGSDAIGGVMSFQTLTPQLSLDDKTIVTGKAITRYSSANQEKTGHFDINFGLNKWAFVSSLSYWDYDHLKQGKHGPDDYIKNYYVDKVNGIDSIIHQDDELLQIPSAYSQFNAMQKIRFKANDSWDFQYGFHYSGTSPYGRYDRHNRTKNDLPRYAEWNYGPQSWMMNNLNINHKNETFLYDQISVRITQQNFEESRIDRSFGKDNQTTAIEKVNALSSNVDFIKSTHKNNTLFYGIEYVLNKVTSTAFATNIITNEKSIAPARYPDSDWKSIGFYLNDELQVSKKFTLLSGIRYNLFIVNANFDTTFYPLPFTEAHIKNPAITGSFGGVYRPSKTWVISTNFGTAFRSPNVDDIGKVFDSEPGAVTIPNPNLKAEYAYNTDLGIAKVFKDVIKLDVTGYYTILDNALVRRNFTLNGNDSIIYDGELSQVQALQNSAMANIYGIQMGIEIKLPKGFQFSTDANYQVGKEELNNGNISASRHAAPFFGVSRFSYKANKLYLQVYSVYQAEKSFDDLPESEKNKDEIYAKDSNGKNYAPAWYTLNFKGSYEINKYLAANIGVENITNQRYRPYSSGISAPGLNFITSLRVKF